MDVNSGTDNLLSRDIGGERLRSAQEILMKCYFNPRPHVEGDLFEKSARLAELISILALVWWATITKLRDELAQVFQSSPSRGGRLNAD